MQYKHKRYNSSEFAHYSPTVYVQIINGFLPLEPKHNKALRLVASKHGCMENVSILIH